MSKLLLLIKREMRVEARQHALLLSTFFFSLLLVVITSISFDPGSLNQPTWASGLYWLIFLFSTSLLFSRSYRFGQEQAEVKGVLMAGVSSEIVFLSKVIFNYLVLTVLGMFLTLMISVFYNLSLLDTIAAFVPTMLIANLGITTLGTFASAMLRQARLRQLFITLLFYPLILPLVIPAIHVTRSILAGHAPQGQGIILSCNLIFIGLAILMVNHLIEDE